MSRIIVTGGAGFIGSHLTDALVAEGHEVLVIDNLSTGKKEYINSTARFKKYDIAVYKKIAPLFKGVDAVFHCAADARVQVSIEEPLKTHATNVDGTLNVLEAARRAGVKKIIFTSSCTVYGDCTALPLKEEMRGTPLSPYGLHKLIGEEYAKIYARVFGVSTVTLRLFNVYGPRKTAEGAYPMVIPIFLAQKKRGIPLTVVGDGEQTRDYVEVRDVVAAFIAAWRSPVGDGSAFNIAGGEQWSVNAIARLVGGPLDHIPPRQGEMRFVEADITRSREALGWTPKVKFEEGLVELKSQVL